MRLASCLLLASPCFAVSVLTGQYDNARDGSNLSETTFTQANVGSLKKIGTFPVDGQVWAEPLIVDGVSIRGASRVLLTVTMAGSLYAFNADTPNTGPLWVVRFGAGYSAYPMAFAVLYGGTLACLSTPVATTSVVYAVCQNQSGSHMLYSYNLDGTQFHAAVTLSGTFSSQTFVSTNAFQRCALTLSGGKIIIATSSYNDGANGGWVFSYDASTLAQSAVWLDNNALGAAAGIWMSAGGVSVDGSGNLYLVTGNGAWDGTNKFGESFVKLSSSLTESDYGTPSNWATLNSMDEDLGSGWPVVFGSNIVGGGKDGKIWLFPQSNLGQLQGSGPGPTQVFTAVTSSSGGIGPGIVFANNVLYVAGAADKIYSFSFNGTTFNTTATASTSSTWAFPGAALAYTSNGSTANTELIWAVTPGSNANSSSASGTLRVFNASTLSQLYSSGTVAGDALGTYSKFAAPIVANGSVFVPTLDNQIVVYGLTTPTPAPATTYGQITFSGNVVVQ